MKNVHQAIVDMGLAAQGRSLLCANELVRRVDAVWHSAWSWYLDQEPNELNADAIATRLVDGAFSDTFDVMLPFVRECAEESWETTAGAIARSVPLPLLQYGAATRPAWSFGEDVNTLGAVGELFVRPTPAQVDAVVFARTAGSSWPERLSRWDNATDIGEEIRQGVLAGHSRDRIARRILPLVDGKRAAANRIARTEVHRINVAMSMETQRQSFGDAQRGWLYLATLDTATRPTHGALDRHEWELGDPGLVIPPWEPNCRCDLVATLQPIEAMPGMDGLLTPGERSAMASPSLVTTVPASTTYGAWFNTLSADMKRDVLGKKLYDALRLQQPRGSIRWTLVLQAFGRRAPDVTRRIVAPSVSSPETPGELSA